MKAIERAPFWTVARAYEDETVSEIPWSRLLDFEALKETFGVSIVERPGEARHLWGSEEPLAAQTDDVLRVEVIKSFRPVAPMNGSWRRWWGSLQTSFSLSTSDAALTGKEGDPGVVHYTPTYSQFMLIQKDRHIVQCGSLSTTLYRKSLQSLAQAELYQALNTWLLARPNKMQQLNDAAQGIIEAMGGSGAFMALGVGDKAKRNVRELSIELLGNMPISQAVSASLPLQSSSSLAHWLTGDQSDRRALLDACVAYRQDVDPGYPVTYLLGESVYDDHARWMRPLFPCVFTRADMLEWKKLDYGWWNVLDATSSANGEEKVWLSSVLDILVASQAYSFLEIPTTGLSKVMSWQV
ncbi:hypothetical protein BCR43DRAFT_485994 [Syncephalastrum racemosum]|uniref:Uncharacterized protein n=1 Tax=Syncephalastrum racemosum TaxID=13706 RepID=A0A1X2HNC9_SYNRA|nr:hypothetical protein BCR43DRAFT_485994 [Syncephalastrum racemosum]